MHYKKEMVYRGAAEEFLSAFCRPEQIVPGCKPLQLRLRGLRRITMSSPPFKNDTPSAIRHELRIFIKSEMQTRKHRIKSQKREREGG